jgi:hypothetical protein
MVVDRMTGELQPLVLRALADQPLFRHEVTPCTIFDLQI